MNSDGYEVEDLDRMIEACKRNIATLQKAIDQEQANIDHFEKVKDDVIAKTDQVNAIMAANEAAMERTRRELAEDDGVPV